MEYVPWESNVPLLGVEATINLAQGRVLSFIAPSKLAVLQVYLEELPIIKGVAESDHAGFIFSLHGSCLWLYEYD